MIRKEIARLQPMISGDLESSRKAQDILGELAARVLSSKVEYVRLASLNNAEMAVHPDAFEGMAILYLHGGAYTAGTLAYARGFGGVLADATRISTLCLGYRLAPEHPFPAALEDALAAYRFLLETYPAEKITFAGESAGGGLCYALCLAAREEGLPMPRCCVVISPWTDLTMSFPAHERNREVDPTLTRPSLILNAAMYAGENVSSPLVSPIFGDLSGMPDSLIFAGSCEILEDDSRELAARLTAAGVDCTLHIEEDAWHAYVLYGIYEARQAIEKITEYIWEHMK